MNGDEHDIDKPLSLTNKLFLKESLDQTSLPTILEEDPISQQNILNNTQPITTKFANI